VHWTARSGQHHWQGIEKVVLTFGGRVVYERGFFNPSKRIRKELEKVSELSMKKIKDKHKQEEPPLRKGLAVALGLLHNVAERRDLKKRRRIK